MKQGNGLASIISLIWTMMRSEVLICLRVYVRVIITNNWLWAFFVLDISIKKWMCSMICHNYVVITTEKCFESKPWLSTRRTGSWFLPHFVRYMISIRKCIYSWKQLQRTILVRLKTKKYFKQIMFLI